MPFGRHHPMPYTWPPQLPPQPLAEAGLLLTVDLPVLGLEGREMGDAGWDESGAL